MKQYACLGVEELNLDFSDSLVDDWQLHSAKEELENFSQSSNQIKFFYDLNETKAEHFVDYLQKKFPELLVSAKIKTGNSEDWENEWKKYLNPIQVSDNLKIKFTTDVILESEIAEDEIIIYPGMGFGTGGHETTSLCLQLIEAIGKNKEIEACLDFGCGSGILGILASKKNARKIDFFDIDEDALTNCNQNLKVNGLENINGVVTHRKSSLLKSYDLVVANILLNILNIEKNYLFQIAGKISSCPEF